MVSETILTSILELKVYEHPEYLKTIQAINIDCEPGIKVLLFSLNECFRQTALSTLDNLLKANSSTPVYETISRFINFLISVQHLRDFYAFLLTTAEQHFEQNPKTNTFLRRDILDLYNGLVEQSHDIVEYLRDLSGKSEIVINQALLKYQVFLLENKITGIPYFADQPKDEFFFVTVDSMDCVENTRIALQDIKDCKTNHLILIYPRTTQLFREYVTSQRKDIRDRLVDHLLDIRDNLVNEVVIRDYNAYYESRVQKRKIEKVVDQGHLNYRNSLIPFIEAIDQWVEFLQTNELNTEDAVNFESFLNQVFEKISSRAHGTLIVSST